MTRRSLIAILAGVALSWLLVEGLAIAAVIVTTPFHDVDDGANMAGVLGLVAGPVVAAGIVGFCASRVAVHRHMRIGYVGAFAASFSAEVPSLVRSAQDYPEYAAESVGTAVVIAIVTAVLVTPAVWGGRRRARRSSNSPSWQEQRPSLEYHRSAARRFVGENPRRAEP